MSEHEPRRREETRRRDSLHRREALGKRLASYRSRFPTRRSLATNAVGLVLFGLALTRVLGDQAWWLIFACGAIYFTTVMRRHPHFRALTLHQHGIDLRLGRRHRYVYWNQIYEIYQRPEFPLLGYRRDMQPTGWSYRLVQRDGRSLRFGGFESIRGLGMKLQSQVARRQLPVALDAFRAGYCVRFGRHLAVSTDGLHFGPKLVSWDEISEISIDEADELQVMKIGQAYACARLSCSQIPNLAVLDGILQATQDESELTEVDGDPPLFESDDEVGHTTALLEDDETTLLLEGFDVDEIQDVHSGEVSHDELRRRGPRHRPRRPR